MSPDPERWCYRDEGGGGQPDSLAPQTTGAPHSHSGTPFCHFSSALIARFSLSHFLTILFSLSCTPGGEEA